MAVLGIRTLPRCEKIPFGLQKKHRVMQGFAGFLEFLNYTFSTGIE
jgi:hypothetical protein